MNASSFVWMLIHIDVIKSILFCLIWDTLCDAMMGTMASQITSLTSVYSTVYSGADQRKHQSSASLAFVWGIHRWPVNSPHKWPVTRKMFPFDDVIMVKDALVLTGQRFKAVKHGFRDMASTNTIMVVYHYHAMANNKWMKWQRK